ncbi:MAG: hypothetical protein PUB43_09610 [Oscillospiraceae bacterium]|nr:hypothetical protein [Oscillospiraceae bacterium]
MDFKAFVVKYWNEIVALFDKIYAALKALILKETETTTAAAAE